MWWVEKEWKMALRVSEICGALPLPGLFLLKILLMKEILGLKSP